MNGRRDTSSVPSFLDILQKRWKLLAAGPLLAGLVAFGYALTLSDQFTAECRFVTIGRIDVDASGGIDRQLQNAAMRVGAGRMFQTTDLTELLPTIMTGWELLDTLLSRRYITSSNDEITLEQFLEGSSEEEGKIDPKVRERHRKQLVDSILSLEVDEMTGVSTLHVTLSDPAIAAEVASSAVDEIQKVSRSIFTGRAHEQAMFIADRIEDIQERLQKAESELVEFREQNRIANQSPQLKLEEERLIRKVQLNEHLFITLKTQEELARIDEAKNTSMLSILDKPTRPLSPSGPKRLLLAAFAFLGVLSLFVVVIVIRDYPLAE